MEPTKPNLHLLGIRFQDAPIEIREALILSQDEILRMHRMVTKVVGPFESMVLSTCNRTEFYLSSSPGQDVVQHWIRHLNHLRPNAPLLDDSHHCFHLRDSNVAHHLFRVAGGLESAILGDSQILGQLKRVHQAAGDNGTLGPELSRLSQSAIRAGKRLRSETALGKGAASIGSAIADMITPELDQMQTNDVLLIGAGETSRIIALHLRERAPVRLTFVNRTYERAAILANECKGIAMGWNHLSSLCHRNKFIISATSSPDFVLRSSLLCQLRQKPLLVDAGAPRNIEPTDHARVWNIDQIRERQNSVLKERRSSLSKAEQIIWEELQKWASWHAARPIENFIQTAYTRARNTSAKNAQDLASHLGVSIPQAEKIIFNSISGALMPHARKLRHAAATNRLNESEPVSAALAMAELSGLN